MNKISVNKDQNKYNRLIFVLSILIPLVVAILFGVKIPNVEPLMFLPPIYATINGLTAVLLIVALIAIKNGKRALHELLMKVNLGLSINLISLNHILWKSLKH